MFKNKDEPRVRTRSPILLMVITLAVYLDCIFKLCILNLDYKFVDLKCQMAIFTRCFNHYMAYVFIIVRILRVHRVNELQEQIYQQHWPTAVQPEGA